MVEFTALFQAAWAASPIGVTVAILFALSNLFGMLRTQWFITRWIVWPTIYGIGYVLATPRRMYVASVEKRAKELADARGNAEAVARFEAKELLADVQRMASARTYSVSAHPTHPPHLQDIANVVEGMQSKLAAINNATYGRIITTPEGWRETVKDVQKILSKEFDFGSGS